MFKKFLLLKEYISLYQKSFALVYQSSKYLTIMMLIALILQVIIPAFSISLANSLLNNVLTSSFNVIMVIVGLWGFLFILSNILTPLNTLLQGQLTDKLTFRLKKSLMEKSQGLQSLDLFEQSDFHDEIEIIISQASWRPVNLLVFGTSIISSFIALISMLILLSTFSFYIALAMFVALIPQGIVFYKIQQQAFEILVSNSSKSRKMNYYSDSVLNIQKIKEIRLYNAYSFFIKKYEEMFSAIITSVQKNRLKQFVISTIFLVFTGVISITSFIFVILGIQSGAFQIGAILIFSGTIIYVVQNIARLVEDSSLLYMEKYFNFMALKNVIKEGYKPFNDDFNTISFENISFAYPQSEKNVLENLSFSINRGEKIAIVGENGSGKSTLVKVLLRFYKLEQGDVCFDGISFNDFEINNYRQNFSAVFQDFAKFDLTIAENIEIAHTSDQNNSEKIKKVLEQSQLSIDENIQLGKSFDGTELSGGQWQKLAIARAFFRDSELLILDEPTASIDARAEAQLYEYFLELSKEKTVIFITHRLSTVKKADKVLVIKDGKLLAFDSHSNLMETNDYYQELYDLQVKSYQ